MEQDVKSITESGKNHSKKEKSVKNKKKSRDKKTVKPTKEHEQPKDKEIKHSLKKTDFKNVSDMKVGDELTDKDGNRIKRTESNVYILLYHQNPKESVAFEKKGDKWIVDCCTKRGIEFNASEIDNAVEYIKESWLSYEQKKRKEQKQKKKNKKIRIRVKRQQKIKDAIKIRWKYWK